MKRGLAIIFLSVFLLQSMSQLFILGSFYLNRNYISENICVNRFEKIPVCKGQCYLSKGLTENEKKAQNFPDLKQKEVQLICEEHSLSGEFIPAVSEQTIFAKAVPGFYPNTFRNSVFHPPQLA